MPTPDPRDPKLDPKAHADDASVREGYEVTDANTGGIVVFLVGLFISVGVFFVFCFGMGKVINNGLDRADGQANKWNAPNQIAPRKTIQSNPALEQEQLAKLTQQFPTPRLETDDGNQDLANLHEREDLLLDYYSWIDRSKGTVRIPIERAMELICAARAAGGSGATAPGADGGGQAASRADAADGWICADGVRAGIAWRGTGSGRADVEQGE